MKKKQKFFSMEEDLKMFRHGLIGVLTKFSVGTKFSVIKWKFKFIFGL